MRAEANGRAGLGRAAVVAALLLASPAAVAAETPAPGQAAPPAAPALPPAGPDVRRDTPEIARLGQRLRCPVCQGMAIGDSPAPMAQDMMRQVRRMWADGRSEDDIAAYFTARYGDWVLLDPPWRGAGFWVWVAPPTALVLGVAWALRSLRRRAGAAPAHGPTPTVAAVYGAGDPADAGVHDDLQAIRKEVAR